MKRLALTALLMFAPLSLSAQELRTNVAVTINAKPIQVDLVSPRKVYSGPLKAVVFDLTTRTESRIDIGDDKLPGPDSGNNPANDVRFDIPVRPPDVRFGLIETDVGSCSTTFIGRRYFLTAAHCVYNSGWPRWARVLPGYSDNTAPIGMFNAKRLFSFDGFTVGGDVAHDVAIIEVERDLPRNIRPVPVRSKSVDCSDGNFRLIHFRRTFYEGGGGTQKYFDHEHRGCLSGLLWFFTRTLPGSSGSATLENGETAYAVLRGYTSDRNRGVDALITRTKECFIREHLLQEYC